MQRGHSLDNVDLRILCGLQKNSRMLYRSMEGVSYIFSLNIADEYVYTMEEWDPAINDFVLRCNSCWRTNKYVKIIRTSREKYYCEQCLSIYDLCHS
jgi:hypothetical protein